MGGLRKKGITLAEHAEVAHSLAKAYAALVAVNKLIEPNYSSASEVRRLSRRLSGPDGMIARMQELLDFECMKENNRDPDTPYRAVVEMQHSIRAAEASKRSGATAGSSRT